MSKNKEVMMYAILAFDKVLRDYMDFITIKSLYMKDALIRASQIEDESREGIVEAVDETLHVMKMIKENSTGDANEHSLRMKKVAEIKSIMHISAAFPDKAVKRLKELPTKRLINA